jgi:hypothetical protein
MYTVEEMYACIERNFHGSRRQMIGETGIRVQHRGLDHDCLVKSQPCYELKQ